MRIKIDESKLGLLVQNHNDETIADIILFSSILEKVENDFFDNYYNDESKLNNKEIICVIYDFDQAGKITELKKRNPNTEYVLLLGFNIYPDLFSLPIDKQVSVMNDIKVADAIMTSGIPEKQYFKFINEKIDWLGIPFDNMRDLSKYESLLTDNNLIGVYAGKSHPMSVYNNHISGLHMLESVREKFWPEMNYILLNNMGDSERDMISKNFPGYLNKNIDSLEKYYSSIVECNFILNLNVNYTFGRIAGECAMLNTVCVGSKTTDLQKLLFPKFAIDVFNMDGFYIIIQSLHRSPKMKNSILNFAKCRITDYNVKVCKRRFFDNLVKLLGGTKDERIVVK